MEVEEKLKTDYYCTELKSKYISYSQLKDFEKCEYECMKKIKGEVVQETTDALLIGSYVDAHYSNEEKEFLAKHPEMFSKQGTLLKKYEIATKVINSIDNDPIMHKCVADGEHQVTMVGEIEGCPIRIRIDSYFAEKGYIFDQKVIRDTQVWIEKDGRNKLVNFIDGFGYLTQGALYREIVRQNTNRVMPFVICATTKTNVPKNYLLELDSEDLDKELERLRPIIRRLQDVKDGKIEPKHCGCCDTCLSEKKVTGIFSYHTLDPKKWEDNDVEF